MIIDRIKMEEIGNFKYYYQNLEKLIERLAVERLHEIDFDEIPMFADYPRPQNVWDYDGKMEAFFEKLKEEMEKHNVALILINLITLLENCANLDSNALEFNHRIAAAFELLEQKSSVK